MLKAYTLFSGSGGNCVYIKSNNTEILIDAGKPCRTIEKALLSLGTSLKNIEGIFITHEHSDHTGGLEIISKKYQIPVYITSPSYDSYVRGGSFLQRVAKPQPIIYDKAIGDISVSSFPVPHDSAQNVGYIVKSGKTTFGIATDIGHLTDTLREKLSCCSKVIIEANHDLQMIKSGPYPQILKDRILSDNGHLSNESCAEFCAFLCENGVGEITLAHLSPENNFPRLAYETVKERLHSCGFDNVTLKVAFADIIVCATNGKSYPFPTSEGM